MSDNEDFVIDGRPASELRVVDLKELLEKRGLSKTGSKSVLLKRLKESLNSATSAGEADVAPEPAYVPNMEMKSCGSNIVAQYLEKQQQALLAAKKAAQETRTAKGGARSGSVSSDKSDSIVNNVEEKRDIANEEKNIIEKIDEKETRNGSSAYSEDIEHTEAPVDSSEVPVTDVNEDKELSTVHDEPPSVQETTDELVNEDTERTGEQQEHSFATGSTSPADDHSTTKPDQQSVDERREDRSMDSDKSPASDSGKDVSKNNDDDVESSSSPRLQTAGSGNELEEDDDDDDNVVGEDEGATVTGQQLRPPPTSHGDPSSDSPAGDVIQLPSLDDYPLSIDRLLPAAADDDNDREDNSQHSGTENATVTEKPQKKRRWGSTTVGKRATVSISSDSLKEIVGNVKPTEVALLSESLEEGLEQLDYDEEPVIKRIVVSRDEDGAKDKTTDSGQHSMAASDDQIDRRQRKIIDFEELTPQLIGDEEYVRVRPPSPARRPPSRIIHVHGLTRPFNFKSWLQFLSAFGPFSNQDDFWIDGIKSHCLVRYATIEEATKARENLDCIAWPKFNRNSLRAEFAAEDDLDRFKRMASKENDRPVIRTVTSNGMPEHRPRMVREIAGNDNNMEMDKQTRVLKQNDKVDPWPKNREWDRGKEDWRGGLSPSRAEPKQPERRQRREISPVQRRQDAKEKVAPAKLLEDLFKKTKTTPFIYWLPLTQEQINEKANPQKSAVNHQKTGRGFEDRSERFSPPARGGGRDRDFGRDRNFDRDRDSARYDRQRRR